MPNLFKPKHSGTGCHAERAVIVTFTVCDTDGSTLLLVETVIIKHAQQMAKCQVARVSPGVLYFSTTLLKLHVNSVLLNLPRGTSKF